MMYSRRVHRLLLICAGLTLNACAGQIELTDADLTSESSAAPYGAGPSTLASNQPSAELVKSTQPSTSTSSTKPNTTKPSRGDTAPDTSDTEAQAPTSPTPAQPIDNGSNETPVVSQPDTDPVAPAPVVPAPVVPAPVEPAPMEPAPVVPAPVEPAPVVPAPVEPEPEVPAVPVPPLAAILWTDNIQSSQQSPWGFNQVQLERPIGQSVGGSSEVNMTRVPNPIGSGFAMKHVATFDNNGGSRSQAGIYSGANHTFEQQVKSPEGIWIAQEWYFPEALSAGTRLDSEPWINLWDFHSVGGGDRWDTQPGLMLAEDGSMRVKWTWRRENPETAWSQIDLPVGEWFDVEMHYVWTSSGATVSFWINGELALQQHGVKTKSSSHSSVETYMKFYGSANGGTSWSPRPAVKYTRNVRIAGERIWR